METKRDNEQAELTDREIEIAALVANGYSNRRIAQKLGIRENTVKAHLTTIMRKLDVMNRTGAGVWIYQNRPELIISDSEEG